MSMDFDFSDFSPDDEDDYKADMQTLTADGEEAIAILGQIKELELEQKELELRLKHIVEKRIPHILITLGMAGFKLNDGTEIKLVEKVAAPQLDEKKDFFPFAEKYLIENDGADLIKTRVALDFGKSEHNAALSLIGDLREKGFDPVVGKSVHSGTYTKFGNELLSEYKQKLEKGLPAEEIPFKELGMFVVRKADIKAGKGKK